MRRTEPGERTRDGDLASRTGSDSEEARTVRSGSGGSGIRPGRVTLRDARRATIDQTWLRNVYPLYLHDLSEFDPGFYELDERGIWQPDYLGSWLADDRDVPLLILTDGRPVGFALVNRGPSPHVAAGCNYRMSEFFVLRRARGAGIGTRAAHAVFDLHPGRWEVSQLLRNVDAIRFWRRVIGLKTDGLYEETADAEEVRQTFQTRAAARRRSR